ncbi:MAG: zinc ABC transporter substrate-binding protein [Pseudomonadota bacterium]
MLRTSALALLVATPALADAPRVVTDIAPIHSLTARVMQGVGTPELIVDPGTSPHDFAFRPSQARALSDADVVFSVGHALTPWLEEPLETLAEGARSVELMDVPGMMLMSFREGATFAEHDHDDDHDDHDDHAEHDDHDDHGAEKAEGHDDHDDHAHGDEDHAAKKDDDDHDHDHGAEEAKHDDDHGDEHAHDDHDDHGGHKEEHADAHGHDDHAGEMDPHIWLDPVNGARALTVIADTLADVDPDNAGAYLENARQARAELDTLTAELTATLEGAAGKPFIVFHDAYHYFEARFGVEAVGSVSEGDAAAPGASRIAELRALVSDIGTLCAFAEPQMNTALLETVVEGADAKLGVIDPLGAALEPGPNLYPDLLRNVAGSLAGCLNS